MQLNFKSLGQGRPLVLLHGLFGSLDNWLGVTPKLAQHFQLFLPDLRNHGASPHSPEMNYPAMAADLAEFFDAQKLDAANLLGHSLGGKVAMQFASQFPHRVEKLIVVDIDPRAYPHEHDVIFAALLSLDLKKFQNRKEVEDTLAPAIPDLTLRRFLLKNLRHTSDSALEWRIPLNAIFENYPKLCRPLPAKEPFSKPTLFIRGGQSPYIDDADYPLIHQFFPAATIETIPQAHHWVHADAPNEFVRLILEFLNNSNKV
jgi:esterase